MFTPAYAASWPIFAINLTLLPLALLEVDAVVRAYEQHRYFLLKLQVVLSVLMVFGLWYGITNFGLVGAISVVVVINFLLRVVLALKFTRVLGAGVRDLLLLKDVGKIIVASAVAGVLCLFVHSMLIASGTRPFIVLVVCGATFVAVYLPAILLLAVPTDDEREKVRRGVERYVHFRRSANSVS
jgi:hypothetical protein